MNRKILLILASCLFILALAVSIAAASGSYTHSGNAEDMWHDLELTAGDVVSVVASGEPFCFLTAVLRIQGPSNYSQDVDSGNCTATFDFTVPESGTYSFYVQDFNGRPAPYTLTIAYTSPDADEDGIFDSEDNCVNTANPNQQDSDHDSIGDVCDNTPYLPEPAVSPVDNRSPQQRNACPNAVLTALNYTNEALPAGGGIFCRATPASIDYLVSQPPPGYGYAHQPASASYFDVFGLDAEGKSFGELLAPLSICFKPAAVSGQQVIATYGGYPDTGWVILPTSSVTGEDGDVLCADTATLPVPISRGYALLIESAAP